MLNTIFFIKAFVFLALIGSGLLIIGAVVFVVSDEIHMRRLKRTHKGRVVSFDKEVDRLLQFDEIDMYK